MIPQKVGDFLPPCAIFSLNFIHGKQAILFGGSFVHKGGATCRSNDVFIVTCSSTHVVCDVQYSLSLVILYSHDKIMHLVRNWPSVIVPVLIAEV